MVFLRVEFSFLVLFNLYFSCSNVKMLSAVITNVFSIYLPKTLTLTL